MLTFAALLTPIIVIFVALITHKRIDPSAASVRARGHVHPRPLLKRTVAWPDLSVALTPPKSTGPLIVVTVSLWAFFLAKSFLIVKLNA